MYDKLKYSFIIFLIFQMFRSKRKNKQNQKYIEALDQNIYDTGSVKDSMLEMSTVNQSKSRSSNSSGKENSRKKGKDLIKSNRKSKVNNQQEKKVDEVWPTYKKFFGYTLKRWKMGLICVILSMFSGFVNSLFPLKIGQLLNTIASQDKDNIQNESFREQLNKSMISLGILTLVIGLTSFARFYILQNYQQRLGLDLKQEIYSLFIRNDIHFFEVNQSNVLVSRITNDVNQAKSAISNNLTYLSRSLVTIITTIIILMIMSWVLALFLLIMIPLFIIVAWAYSHKAKALIKKRQDIEADISQHIGEKFLGINIIKSFGTQDREIKKYNDLTQDTFTVEKSRILFQGLQISISGVLPSLGTLLVLIFAGFQLLNGTLSLNAGELTSFILYCNILSSSMMAVSSTYSNLINGISSIQKVIQMMDYQRLLDEDNGRQIELDGSLEFRNVQFRYPKATQSVFKNLNFKINKGEYVGFIGQSGSGKSTITKLIQKFYALQGGDIYFNESSEPSAQLNIRQLRSQIGIVSQDATVFSGTIEYNITYGLDDYSQQELEAASKKAGCLEFITNEELFPQGFQSEVGERGCKVSGGQKQRIAIARCLMRKPQILIFDEATSALDSHSEHIVQNSIQELAEGTQMTIIVIAHRLSTVINCDKLFVMKEGEIVETGSHKELLRQKGYYYSLIEKQLHDSQSDDEKR